MSSEVPTDGGRSPHLSSKKTLARKRSKSFVAAVKNFFGRSASEPESSQDEYDTVSKAESSRQEDAWMQACYNSLAFLFVFITGCIIISVYYVLEPFLHPLLWAVLVGMVLHPFKHMSTSEITQWLQFIRESGIPLSLGIVFTPLFLFNWASCKLETIIVGSWKMITGLAITILCFLLMYILDIHLYIYMLLEVLFSALNHFGSFVTPPFYVMMISVLGGFIVLLLLAGGITPMVLRLLSLGLWFLGLLSIATAFLGSLAIPLVIILFIATSILSVTWKMKPKRPRRRGMDETLMEEKHYFRALSFLTVSLFSSDDEEEVEVENKGASNSPSLPAEREGDPSATESLDRREEEVGRAIDKDPDDLAIKEQSRVTFRPLETVGERRLDKDGSQVETDLPTVGKLQRSQQTSKEDSALYAVGKQRVNRLKYHHRNVLKARERSNLVFFVLLVACFIVLLWKYPLLLFFLSLLSLWSLLRYAFTLSTTLSSQLQNTWGVVISLIKSKKWLLFPPPLPTMIQMFLFLDQVIIGLAVKSVGSLVTSCIILGLLVGVAMVSFLVLFQIQVELSHYMTVGRTVWDQTISNNSQISQWLGNNESVGYSFDIFAKQGYEYGRVWLSELIVSVTGGNSSLVEKRILEIFDKIYHSYFLSDTHETSGHDSLWHVLNESSSVAMFGELKVLMSNNLETILSVLKSLGSIASENFSIVLSLLYSLLQLLFSGGTTLFNMIIFISTLFYLLNASEEKYLPVQWVMDLFPHLTPPTPNEVSKEQGEAFQRAIRSVFHASFRRAFFYGLYTWLTHTILGIPVSILPSVLAGVAGAIPFIGAYWISLPAILELWLMDSRPLSAIALLILSFLPVFFVDNLINGEIEGGHPYLTGLAIAGGIYFAGLEGALIGPILLSCLLFFVDIYGDVFNT